MRHHSSPTPPARCRRILAAAATTVALVAGVAPAPAAAAANPSGSIPAPVRTVLVADPIPAAPPAPDPTGSPIEPTATGVPSSAAAGAIPANDDFVLDFDDNVDPATRAVLEAAAGVWSAALETVVPITVGVEMQAMDPGMLGAAGPTTAHYGRAEFPRHDELYPVALANQLAGRDLDPNLVDMQLTLASTISWDKAIGSSSTSPGQSMLSVAIHEIGHGLGHTSWVRRVGDGFAVSFDVGETEIALGYDRLVGTASGIGITTVSSSVLASLVTSPLAWLGTRGRAANGGVAPRLYSPPTFESGSSVGHLDEATFTSGVMTPFLSRGEVHTSIPGVTRAMLADLGWSVVGETPTPRQPSPSTPAPSPTPTPRETSTTTAAGRAEAFVEAVAQDFLGRSATGAERSRWASHLLAGGSRDEVTRAFAFSDEWIGVIVDGLYRSTLGRRADARGRAHWSGVIRSGSTPAQVASFFYASDEYVTRTGGTTATWITGLYEEILGRRADVGGLGFWLGVAASGDRTVVAYDFYQSLESRRDRVDTLFRSLLGRRPDTSGGAYWAGVLADGRDVDLAMFLAASDEYASRASTRFG